MMGQKFIGDMLYLLRFSMFQPAKVIAKMQSLHPDLTVQTGLIQQFWLAGRSAKVRRFLGLQITIWFVMGLLSFVLMVAVRVATGASATLTWVEVAFDAIFGLIGSIMVAAALCVVGGVPAGIIGSIVGGLLLAFALGLSFGLAGGSSAGIALGLAGGVVLGTVGATFDHLRRPNMELSSLSYWGQAAVGTIFGAINVTIFGLALSFAISIANTMVVDVTGRIGLGAIFGVIGGLMLMGAASLGMRLEAGHVNAQHLKWYLVDSLLLGVIGGIAGGLVLNVTGGLAGAVALVVLWGVLVGAGGGLAMQAGNGLSAILAAAGLTWLLVASPRSPFAPTALLAVGATLLAGLFSYVRLPLGIVEMPLTRWQYLRALRRPSEIFARLHRTPIYWDDLIFYPLPALDQLLLMALRADRTAGLGEVAFMGRTFRQGRAGNRAQLAFAVETLAGCNSPTAIAAAPAALDWLADEVITTLPQGTGEVIPRLLAIASGVRVSLTADNPYSCRLGYREALDSLDALQRRLPSLGPQATQWWQPVIDQWQRLLLNELELVSTTTITTVTENPYQPGNPLQLVRRELFKGRQELREAVVNALLERHRPTLVLHGPRRMGKTSFLLQLPALLPGNTLPVFLDLQRPTATQSTAAFFYNIARAISRDARPYRLLVDPPLREGFAASPFEAFAAWLEDVGLPALQDFNVLLTFDEFEKLGEAVESGRLDRQIFDELRYLIQHQTRLALLFAGVQTLDELGPAWSSYFINVKPLAIGYLHPAEAEELIRQPDRGASFNLTYADDVVAEILSQTACHPYLLQLLCSAIVDESNSQTTLYVDRSLLEAALPRALDQGEPYFRNIWDEMAGPEGRVLLHHIAEAAAPVNLREAPVLTHLVRRRILKRNDSGYCIEVPLVRRWLVERAPPL